MELERCIPCPSPTQSSLEIIAVSLLFFLTSLKLSSPRLRMLFSILIDTLATPRSRGGTPGPATNPPYIPPDATFSPANVDGGFSVIVSNLIGGDDPMLTLATLQGAPLGDYPIALTVEDRGTGVDVFAYNYQIDGRNTEDITTIPPTFFTLQGTYQIVP